MIRGGSGEQSREALPKNLIRPLPYRITKASGSGDLLSRSPMHAGARDGVDYGGGTSSEIGKTLNWFRGVLWHSRTGVYKGGSGNPNGYGVGHAHVAHVPFGSVTDSPRSGSDPN